MLIARNDEQGAKILMFTVKVEFVNGKERFFRFFTYGEAYTFCKKIIPRICGYKIVKRAGFPGQSFIYSSRYIPIVED